MDDARAARTNSSNRIRALSADTVPPRLFQDPHLAWQHVLFTSIAVLPDKESSPKQFAADHCHMRWRCCTDIQSFHSPITSLPANFRSNAQQAGWRPPLGMDKRQHDAPARAEGEVGRPITQLYSACRGTHWSPTWGDGQLGDGKAIEMVAPDQHRRHSARVHTDDREV